MRIYLKARWKKRKTLIKSNLCTEEEAAYNFRFDYVENDHIFRIEWKKLWVVDFLGEPD